MREFIKKHFSVILPCALLLLLLACVAALVRRFVFDSSNAGYLRDVAVGMVVLTGICVVALCLIALMAFASKSSEDAMRGKSQGYPQTGLSADAASNSPRGRLSSEMERYAELVIERPELFRETSQFPLVSDMRKIAHFAERERRKMGVVYESDYNMMVVDAIEGGKGGIYAYERVVPASKGEPVVVIPVIGDKVVLLEQCRHALRGAQLAFPRGFGEEGISASDNAEKELKEELGAVSKSTTCIGKVAPDSGLTSCVASVFLCEIEGYKRSGEGAGEGKQNDDGVEQGEQGDSEGILNATEMSLEEFEGCVAKGDITDGYTLAAYTLLRCSKEGACIGEEFAGVASSGCSQSE